MNTIFNKLARTVAITVSTGLLSAGVANAQTVVPANRTQVSQSTLRGVTTPATIDRIVAPANPVRIKGFDGGGPQKCDPASIAAAAAVVAASAAVAMLVTEVAHHTHDSYLPPGVDLGSRGNLVSAGMYDR
jgi:hypothetical protein